MWSLMWVDLLLFVVKAIVALSVVDAIAGSYGTFATRWGAWQAAVPTATSKSEANEVPETRMGRG